MSEESAAWIEDRFLDWQKENGRASLAKFSKWLGTSPNSLNNWISRKQTPTGDSLKLLGEKLGWEIYDIVGVMRPDPRLESIVKFWGQLSEEIKAALYADATRYADFGTEDPVVATAKRRSKK